MGQPIGGKLLTHGTKHHKDNQLRWQKLSVKHPIWEYKSSIKVFQWYFTESHFLKEEWGAETSREVSDCRTKIT